jgi:hypothetical protein
MMFQRFMVIVNNMRANDTVLSYNDHDRAMKLMHSLDRTIWGRKVETILKLGTYETLTVDELFFKLKSAEVDCGVGAKIEGLTDLHSLYLGGGSGAKSNSNPSSKMYSLPSCL